jgi:hypothetical protein
MVINRSNYFNTVQKFGIQNLPASLKEGHEYVEQATEKGNNWKYYQESDVVRQEIDQHMADVKEFLSKKSGSKKKSMPVKQAKPKTSRKPTPKEKPKAKPSATPKLVHHLKDEVKFIKRFVGLHNKVKTPNAVLAFIKTLQKSIVQKHITKDSLFAKEIKDIQEKLIRIYNNMKSDSLIKIEEKLLARMVGIAGGEEVYPSVGFIKSFIGMQGKDLEQKRRENFLKRLKNAASNRKVTNEDPFAEKLKKIFSYLQDYKSGTKVSFEKAELNGLKCICNACDKELGKIYNTSGKRVRRCKSNKYSDAGRGACSYNRGLEPLGKLYDTKGKRLRSCKSGKYSDAGRGACSYNRGLSGVMTAAQVASMQFEMLPFSGVWVNLLGKPEKNFTMIVHGEPGAGKSTFLIKFTRFLSGLGKVHYVSSEEFGSATLTNLVNQYLNPIPGNVEFSNTWNQVNLSDYDFVVLDSVNDLGFNLEDFKTLKQQHPNTAFIAVLQHTKDGQFKGGKEWEHEAQIAGKIEEGTISIYKNRYGVKGNWYFFDN